MHLDQELILSIYIIVIGYVYINQHNIILSPSPHYHPPPKSFNIVQNFIHFGDNDSLHTWYIKNNNKKMTALYFSGNAFNISHKLFHVDVSDRDKIVFHVPFDKWIQNKPELRKFCTEILSKTKQFNELNHNRIEELRKNLVNNDILDSYQIRTVWLLINYLLWRQNIS